ncbi:MAG: protein kinase [Gemmatimonadales bacterium]
MSDPVARLSAALEGRYRIEGELGSGGMATVYLARDLKHDRDVAIKVLRPELAAVIGAERFLAEIKTTANLQHPHILALFDSGQVDGTVFYAMPFVEGESLRDRLAREKQLPLADALKIATEVASALDYAHRHGVIHRDIKPENILLHDGSALVADFGIALAASKSEGATRMTETGMSLGTPHYMSPEQAMGERSLDARTDVYALGAVAYEMLTGDPPFTGSSAQAIVAKVMTEKPAPIRRFRDTVPESVEAAVLVALAKIPADRYSTAAEFAADLASPSGATLRTGVRPAATTDKRAWLSGAIVAAGTLVAGILVGRAIVPRSTGVTEVVRATIRLGPKAPIWPIGNQRLAISPDGRSIVIVGGTGAETSLWVRDVSAEEARPLPESQGGLGPFFSPDGESVGFFTSQSGSNQSGSSTDLKVVSLRGGVARTVVRDSAAGFGADWADDGQIYFTHANRGIARVPSGGGTIVQVSRPDPANGVSEHDYPVILPGSRLGLTTLWRGSVGASQIGLVDLATGAVTEIGNGNYPRYVAPGFLVFGDAGGGLFAAPMDPANGKVAGTPRLILRQVQVDGVNGSLQFAVSASGTLVYQRSDDDSGGLSWVGRDGTVSPVDTSLHGFFSSMSLSPSGDAVALTRSDASLWIKRLPDGALTKLSPEFRDGNRPVWTPDGKSVAFLASRNSLQGAWVRRADGSDQARPAVPEGLEFDEILYAPDGRNILLRSRGAGPGSRYFLVFEPGIDTAARTLLRAPADQYAMALSPDGRWLAYVSEESGAPEVYVRPFPNVDSARIAISIGGGVEPLWARDGSELFFRSLRGGVLAVPVRTRPTFSVRPPVLLFTSNALATGQYYRAWDVDAAGRFLIMANGSGDATQLEIVFNWVQELERMKDGAGSP